MSNKPIGLLLRFNDEIQMMNWVERAQAPTPWGFMADHTPILPALPVREKDELHKIGKTYVMSASGFAPPIKTKETTTIEVIRGNDNE